MYKLHWAFDQLSKHKMLVTPIPLHEYHNQQQFLALDYLNFGEYQFEGYLDLREFFQLKSNYV